MPNRLWGSVRVAAAPVEREHRPLAERHARTLLARDSFVERLGATIDASRLVDGQVCLSSQPVAAGGESIDVGRDTGVRMLLQRGTPPAYRHSVTGSVAVVGLPGFCCVRIGEASTRAASARRYECTSRTGTPCCTGLQHPLRKHGVDGYMMIVLNLRSGRSVLPQHAQPSSTSTSNKAVWPCTMQYTVVSAVCMLELRLPRPASLHVRESSCRALHYHRTTH